MNSSSYFYMTKDGRVIETKSIKQYNKHRNTMRVAITASGQIQVSTVLLMIDHGGPYDDEPVIFETLAENSLGEIGMWRYKTLKEAQEGHIQVVREIMGEGYVYLATKDVQKSVENQYSRLTKPTTLTTTNIIPPGASSDYLTK